MSDHQNENALRIAAYLENRLSPEEREAFKRALSEDDELRLQYVDALMSRAGPGPNTGQTGIMMARAEDTGGVGEIVNRAEDPGGQAEPAEDAAGMGELEEIVREAGVGEREELGEEREAGGNWETPGEQAAREAWEAGWPGGKQGAKRGFLGSGWMVGAAVLLLVIAGVVMFMMTSHQGFWERAAAASALDSGNANEGNGMDSARTGPGAGGGAAGGKTNASAAVVAAGGKEGAADSLYVRWYKPYMRGDDPIELRQYYVEYRKGNYSAVLAAGDSMVMKISAQRLLVRDYMRLYLGLSYLASGDGRNAVRELEGVVLRTKPGDILYETARWYLALAWLKRNDVDAGEAQDKALGLAREISHGYSRYQEPARALVKALGS
jgi:hypothetical protein